MPIVDVRAATHLVDGYIYVIEWGKTRIDHVEHALNSAKGVYEHLLGVVLNKVDLRSLGRYDQLRLLPPGVRSAVWLYGIILQVSSHSGRWLSSLLSELSLLL